jgi:hypothetical protein
VARRDVPRLYKLESTTSVGVKQVICGDAKCGGELARIKAESPETVGGDPCPRKSGGCPSDRFISLRSIQEDMILDQPFAAQRKIVWYLLTLPVMRDHSRRLH